jgi:hypothetical protein
VSATPHVVNGVTPINSGIMARMLLPTKPVSPPPAVPTAVTVSAATPTEVTS